MCKKLMFFISFVLLLGVAAGAHAADLEVNWPGFPIIIPPDGCYEYDEVTIRGTLIVLAGGCLICNDRSHIDGNGGDGPGGDEYAHMIVYGDVWINDRFDMGQDHDAYLSILDGGTFTQQNNSDGIKLPDNDGGVHKIILNNGSTLEAECIELIGYRDAEIHIGPGCTIILHDLDDGIGDEMHDPGEWLDYGYLLPIPPTRFEDISIEYINGGDDGAIVTTPFALEEWATNPNPADGATGVRSAVTEVVLSWTPGSGVIGTVKGRHFVYFGTDINDVNNAPTYEFGWVPPPPYQGWLPAGTTEWNVGNLPLWTTYYWRVDEGPETGGVVKGFVWRFTTGCPLIVGDLNLDCLLNAEDYAILMTTWKEKQYFPWD